MVNVFDVEPAWPAAKSSRSGAVCSSLHPVSWLLCHGQGVGEEQAGFDWPWRSPLSLAAIVYGPTQGPPSPTGGAPAGSIDVVLVSLIERSRLSRPLPVWSVVPAASADSASRLTIAPS